MAKSYFTEVGRICNICGEFKAWELFGTQTAGQNGKKSHCKNCDRFLGSMRRLSGAELEEARDSLKQSRARAAEIVSTAILSLETSWCGGCKQNLPKDRFGKNPRTRDGLRAYCFDCKRLESRTYRERNPEKAAEATRSWAARNPEKVERKRKRWMERNPGRHTELARRWRESNSDRHAENVARYTSRPDVRLHRAIRERIRSMIKGKTKKTFDLLPYTVEELMDHLERQFLKGMSWDNYGDWHIDHIVPLASFNIVSEDCPDVQFAWCLSNLRPLWGADNIKKSAKRIYLV